MLTLSIPAPPEQEHILLFRTDMRTRKAARGLRILAALDAVAAHHGAAPGEIALAWLLTRVTAPIASASRPEQVPGLLRALAEASDEAPLPGL